VFAARGATSPAVQPAREVQGIPSRAVREARTSGAERSGSSSRCQEIGTKLGLELRDTSRNNDGRINSSSLGGSSRLRRRLPSAPSREVAGVEAEATCDLDLHAAGRVGGEGRGQRASFSGRRRMPWAQLLRRLLHVDALSCPRCSTAARSIPMVVLAFLTDPDVGVRGARRARASAPRHFERFSRGSLESLGGDRSGGRGDGSYRP